jgi:hypothetical protein
MTGSGQGGVRMTGPVVVPLDIDETLVHTGGSGARSWPWRGAVEMTTALW